MTPFSCFLETIRRSRQLRQKQLADMLSVNPCYISAMETGRKAPPSKQVLNQLVKVLELSEEEESELWLTAEISQKIFKLPEAMTSQEYLLLHELRQQLGILSNSKIESIRSILKVPNIAIDTNNRRDNM